MSEATLKIRIPEPLLDFGIDAAEVERRAVEWLVLSLFTRGRISSGKAARLLGIHRFEFLDLLANHGIAFMNYSAEEVEEELEAVRDLDQALQ